LAAAAEIGYPIAADINSGLEEGFGWGDLNIVEGRRQSAADACLLPVPPGVSNHGGVTGLIRSDPALDAPDLQIQIIDMPYFAPAPPPSLPTPGQGYTLAFSAMTPRSRGSVRLADARPGTPPRLDPNHYGDARDLDVMATGLRIARAIGRASAFASWRGEEVLPGLDVDDDESVRAYLRRSLRTYSHQVGTCRIGMDAMAVVDTDLRVHGVSGLRVADASVMPSIVSANTNATVYGIAERAAELMGS
jgi:choline dehydrogenase-like flavoprotein